MSFFKSIATILDAVDTVSNEDREIDRDGRTFRIHIYGRIHDFKDLWVFDVTATDVATGTSEEIKHFKRKEDGVDEAIRAVTKKLRESGLLTVRPASLGFSETKPTSSSSSTSGSQHASSRNDKLLKTLVTKGFVTEPQSQPLHRQPVLQPVMSQRDHVPHGNLSLHYHKATHLNVKPIEIEPDVDGLYTSMFIPTAMPTPEQLDPTTTYDMWQSPYKGLVYILNNSVFPYRHPNHRMRNGSEIDLRNMEHVFMELGYEPVTHRNLTRDAILMSIDQLVTRINAEGDKHSSVCLVFMSHGNQHGICGIDSSEHVQKIVTRTEIKEKLSGRRCKALLGKPKLIFIQACRGDQFTRNANELDCATTNSDVPFETDFIPVDTAETSVLDLDASSLINDFDVDGGSELPNNADIFVANATSNGYFSIRVKTDGSWFIQALTEIFLGYGHMDDLNELMRKVTCLVTEQFRVQWTTAKNDRRFEVRQTPAYESQGMRKRFFFMPRYPPPS